jgi:hypothetical protein
LWTRDIPDLEEAVSTKGNVEVSPRSLNRAHIEVRLNASNRNTIAGAGDDISYSITRFFAEHLGEDSSLILKANGIGVRDIIADYSDSLPMSGNTFPARIQCGFYSHGYLFTLLALPSLGNPCPLLQRKRYGAKGRPSWFERETGGLDGRLWSFFA